VQGVFVGEFVLITRVGEDEAGVFGSMLFKRQDYSGGAVLAA